MIKSTCGLAWRKQCGFEAHLSELGHTRFNVVSRCGGMAYTGHSKRPAKAYEFKSRHRYQDFTCGTICNRTLLGVAFGVTSFVVTCLMRHGCNWFRQFVGLGNSACSKNGQVRFIERFNCALVVKLVKALVSDTRDFVGSNPTLGTKFQY